MWSAIMTGRILVVGSLNMDLVVRVSHHPRAGETVQASEFRTFAGGKGANQAGAAARRGAVAATRSPSASSGPSDQTGQEAWPSSPRPSGPGAVPERPNAFRCGLP